MSISFAALLAAAPFAEPSEIPVLGRTSWIAATIEQSEWCPAGNVRLDLESGDYQLTRKAARRVCKTAVDRPVTAGTLGRKRLAAIRTASLRILSEGFESRACREGRPPENLIISNGGVPILVLTTGFATGTAPSNHSCWSAAALELHDMLDETFASNERR